jgi:integrase
MTRIRVRGFQIFKDRHNKWRCYHRATRTPIDLDKHPLGTSSFLAEVARIEAVLKAAPPPRPGTLGGLVKAYRAGDRFRSLKPRTRQDYENVFDFLATLDDVPLVKWTPAFVTKICDRAGKARGWRFGRYVRQVLSTTFNWGIARGLAEMNPAEKAEAPTRPKDAPRANRPWSDDERDAVLAAAPPHLLVPLALMMFTGIDPGDALRLTRAHCDGEQLNLNRAKTGEPVWWPLPERLRAILAAAPTHDAVTVAATSRGRPWTTSGFGTVWQKLRARLIEDGKVRPGLTLKGLRHTVATVLRQQGHPLAAVAAALGHSEKMAAHYSRDADHRATMERLVAAFDVAEANRTASAIVKPFPPKRQTERSAKARGRKTTMESK